MHAEPYAAATFTMVTGWAVGIALAAAVADVEVGLIRDHPVFGRRLAGVVVPPLIVIGLLAPLFLSGHGIQPPRPWVLISMALFLPFAIISWHWSRTWLIRTHAHRRRRLGLAAVLSGGAALLIAGQLALNAMVPPWESTTPIAIMLATPPLLGSLTNFTLLALTAGLPSEVPEGPALNMAEINGGGFFLTLVAGLQVVLASGPAWPEQAVTLSRVWFFASLVVPGCLLLSRAICRRLSDALVMPLALASAVLGQWVAHLWLFLYPGLIPPVPY